MFWVGFNKLIFKKVNLNFNNTNIKQVFTILTSLKKNLYVWGAGVSWLRSQI
jgi:hypothetical protein